MASIQTLPADRSAPGRQPTPPARGHLSEGAIVFVTSLAHLVCHVGELALAGSVLAVMAEFHLDSFQATTLGLLGYVLFGLGAFPVGLWADAWGPTRVLLLYFVAMAAAGIAVAAAVDVWSVFAAFTALGLAASIYHPAGLALLSLGVRRRGWAMGVNGVAGNVGVALGPFLVLTAAAWGWWRWAFVVLAALAGVGAILLAALTLASRRCLPEDNSPRTIPHLAQPADARLDWPALAMLMAVMMLGGFNYRSLVTALPPFLSGGNTEARQLATGAVFTFAVLITGGVGQLLGGWLADRQSATRLYVLLVVALGGFALLLPSLEGSIAAVLVACLAAVCLFALQPVENVLLARATPAARRGLSYGTKFALTFGVGALGAPATGWIWHRSGSPASVFYVLAVSAAGMAVGMLLFRRWQSTTVLQRPRGGTVG